MYRDGQFYQYGSYHKPDRNYYFTKHNENKEEPKYDILKISHDTPPPITGNYRDESRTDDDQEVEMRTRRHLETPHPTRAVVTIEHWYVEKPFCFNQKQDNHWCNERVCCWNDRTNVLSFNYC